MATESQRQRIVSLLDAASDLTIATTREDGYPQATVVSFVNDGTKIYVGTGAAAQKAKNMARNDKVAVALTLPYTTWDQIKGLNLAGRAHRVTSPAEMKRVGELMFKKFPQIAQYATFGEQMDLALFRIDAEVVSILDYSQGFGHTETVDLR